MSGTPLRLAAQRLTSATSPTSVRSPPYRAEPLHPPDSHIRWTEKRGPATVAESFFATLKKELIHRRSWPTKRELIGEAFNYIETFYNPVRRHSTLGMLSPVQFEGRATRSTPSSEKITTTTITT